MYSSARVLTWDCGKLYKDRAYDRELATISDIV